MFRLGWIKSFRESINKLSIKQMLFNLSKKAKLFSPFLKTDQSILKFVYFCLLGGLKLIQNNRSELDVRNTIGWKTVQNSFYDKNLLHCKKNVWKSENSWIYRYPRIGYLGIPKGEARGRKNRLRGYVRLGLNGDRPIPICYIAINFFSKNNMVFCPLKPQKIEHCVLDIWNLNSWLCAQNNICWYVRFEFNLNFFLESFC